MDALAHNGLFWAALIMTLLALYILPTMIAAIRGVPGLGWIIVINLLPTGVGWLAALIAALEELLSATSAYLSQRRLAIAVV